jgi:opacity protein-like surface antigen
MKLNKAIAYSKYALGLAYALTSGLGYAGTMGEEVVCTTGKIYAGVFGGAGSSNRVNIAQFGTAFFREAEGGALAVDAFGRLHRRTVGLVGGQVGYQWAERFLSSLNLPWGLAPAVELEGYYLSKSKFTGHEINNDTRRLPEHDFLVTYPTRAGIFLSNAVLNLNIPNLNRFHPYVAAGIGAAVVTIHRAQALQVAPPEIGINHYNSNPGDTEATFAAQTKVGLNFDFTQNINIFAEYRWLYIPNSKYSFGSTVYQGHAPTSSWLVKLSTQNYNMGAVGIRYSI